MEPFEQGLANQIHYRHPIYFYGKHLKPLANWEPSNKQNKNVKHPAEISLRILLNKKGDKLLLSFASAAPNARRLADSRLNRIPHVVTSFRASKSITSEPADTLWRRTERKSMDRCNPVHIHAQHFNEVWRDLAAVLGSVHIQSRTLMSYKPLPSALPLVPLLQNKYHLNEGLKPHSGRNTPCSRTWRRSKWAHCS